MTTIEAVNLANTPVLAAIAWAYLAINATRIFTYVPQIIAVWRCTDGARAISLLTWGSWAVSHLSGLAYGALVLHDRFFVVITTINLLGCTSVTSIAAMHRWRLHHPPDTTAPLTPPPAKPATSASHLLRVTAKPPAFRWVGAAQLLLAACAGALVTVLWLPPRLPPGTATAMATPHLTARNTIDDLRADASMGRPYAQQT